MSNWKVWRDLNDDNDTGLIEMSFEADGKAIDLYDQRGKIAQALGMDDLDKTVGDILTKSINAAARKAKAQMVEDAKKRYALSHPEILEQPKEGGIRIKRQGSGENRAISLVSKGGMREITDYDISPSEIDGAERSAVSARVLNSHGKKTLERKGAKAFLARFASGHVAVVQRYPGQRYTVAGAIARLEKQKEAKSKFQWDMTRIKKLTAPALPNLFGNEEVIEGTGELLKKIMNEEIMKRIGRELKKKK